MSVLIIFSGRAVVAQGQPAAQAESIPLDQAPNYSLDDIVFRTTLDARVFNTPPEGIRRTDLLKVLRCRRGFQPLAGDIEADVANLVNHYHYFRSVDAALEKTGTRTARLIFTCEDPLIASLEYLELINGQWKQDPEGNFEACTGLGVAVGDPFSIERLDQELRERLFSSERFIDIKEEHRYEADGVHVTIRMVREQMVDVVVLAGVFAESDDAVIKSSSELRDYLDVPLSEEEQEALPESKRRKLGTTGNQIFCSKFAGRHTIEMIRRAVRNYYTSKGYPDTDVTYAIVDVPLSNMNLPPEERPTLAGTRPDLARWEVDAIAERAESGQKVLLLTVHEGPHVEVGAVHFDGIEDLVNAPALKALEPGTLPGSFWPLWYAMPWTEREDRVKRALYQVMQNGPTTFSPHPDFNVEGATQDAAFLERHLRAAGWQDVKVLLKGIQYNVDRSRVELTYDIQLGPLYVLTHVGIRLITHPKLTDPQGPPEAAAASEEDIWERFNYDGRPVDMAFDDGDGQPAGVYALDEPRAFSLYEIEGNPFDPAGQGAQQRVEALFGKSGYSHIQFEATPVYQDAGVVPAGLGEEFRNFKGGVIGVMVALKVDQGFKYRIGEIKVTGNQETKTSVIIDHVSLVSGELFNIDEMRRAENRLRRLQWFETAAPGAGVTITPNFTGNTHGGDAEAYTVDITIHVVEGDTASLNFSAGYSPGASATISLSFAQRNLDLLDWPGITGAGQSVELLAEPRIAERQRYSLTFREPFLFGYPVDGSFSLRISEQDRGPFTVGDKGGEIALGYRVMRDFSVFLRYENFENEVSDVSASAPFEIQREEGTTHFAAMSLTGVYSTLDSPYFPTDGLGATLEGLLASKNFGGSVDMWRLTAGAKHAFLLGELDDARNLSLTISGVSVWQDTYGQTDTVPLAQRLFLGSIELERPARYLRGFKRSGVGPSAGGDAIGGNFLVNASAEMTLTVQPGFFWTLLFVDAGELIPELDNFDPAGFSAAAGIGFRLQVPLFPAPIGIDFGWPIYDQPGNRRQLLAINFAFGF